MSDRRTAANSFLLILALLVLSTRSGLTQPEPQSRQPSAPIAFDRGVVNSDRRPLEPSERLRLRSLRVANRAPDKSGARGSRYVPGRVIVKLRPGLSLARRQAAKAAVSALAPSARLTGGRNSTGFDVVQIDADADVETVAQALAAQPDVEYAQPAYRVSPRFVPNDSLYGQLQWNLRAIDLEQAWDIQRGANNSIVVAILDSGVAFRSTTRQYTAGPFVMRGLNFPALGTISVPFARAPELAADGGQGDSRFVAPFDFIWDNTEPLDLDGHGTHVAGTIGQLTNNSMGVAGIAFNARLMPIKVLSDDWDDILNSPNVGTDDTIARGIRYAADNGAQVINLSLGRTGIPGTAPVVEDAMRYAIGRGAFISVAGGNEFEDGNGVEVYAEVASRIQGAMAVAATDRAGNRAHYSTTGSFIEIAAPGGSVRVGGTNGLVYQQSYDFDFTDTFDLAPANFVAPRFDLMAYIGVQGTSMATAHVSGVAALLMAQGVTNPRAVEAALQRFADDVGPTGRDSEFGFGEINARKTVRGLGLAR